MTKSNNQEFDVVIIGGAFSGTCTALLLKRKLPDVRVLIVEKSEKFDRKVGESTSELAACFLTKELGLSSYLSREHIPKHGLRLWFAGENTSCFSECSEIGGEFQSRLPTYQLDRSKLDQELIDQSCAAGCELWRPARIKKISLRSEDPSLEANQCQIERDGEMIEISAKWIIDASGKAAFLSRKLGHFRKLDEHQTSAIWARFRGVRSLDDWDLSKDFPCFRKSCKSPRNQATNHLMGYGWWCWLIPLQNGDLSAGLVYDSRLFKPHKEDKLSDTLLRHLRSHPVGKEIFKNAEPVEKDTRAFSGLPYYSEKVTAPGWALVGDSAGFIDPLYSQGLDYCAQTVCAVAKFVTADLKGDCAKEGMEVYNREFPLSYNRWYEALYKNKYYYLGDFDLMWAAFLLDLGTYFIGPVRLVYECPEKEFGVLPYRGGPGAFFAKFMRLYNRRFSVIAQKMLKRGAYGRNNQKKRYLIAKGFSPTLGAFAFLMKGVRCWLWLELRYALPSFKSTATNK